MKRMTEISKKMNVTKIVYVTEMDGKKELNEVYIPGIFKTIGEIYTLVHEIEGGSEFVLKERFSGLAKCTLSIDDFLEHAEIEFLNEEIEEVK